MKPVSPVVHGAEAFEVTFAKDQPEYLPLPALAVNEGNRYITRWRMTWRERIKALLFGNVYLWISTFGRPLQPVALTVDRPEIQTPDEPVDWQSTFPRIHHAKRAAAAAFAIILMLLGGCASHRGVSCCGSGVCAKQGHHIE